MTERDRRRVAGSLGELGVTRVPLEGPVYARVNHGRWIADCPRDRGAEYVTEGKRFLCGTCGGTADVVWPAKTTEIERLLSARPVEYQNWFPAETVAMLAAENKANL